MAEAFSNKITRTCGIVSTSTDGSIGIYGKDQTS